MSTINLRKYYPFLNEDCFVEVSDEIAEAFLLAKRQEDEMYFTDSPYERIMTAPTEIRPESESLPPGHPCRGVQFCPGRHLPRNMLETVL